MPVDLIDYDDMEEGRTCRQLFVLWPKKWNAFNLKLDSYTWHEFAFNSASLPRVPKEKGVYSFVIKPNVANHPACAYLIYIGKTEKQNLQTRFGQYLKDQAGKGKPRPKVYYLLKKYADNISFVCMPLDNKMEPGKVEDELLKAFLPPMNDKYPVEVSRIVKGIFS